MKGQGDCTVPSTTYIKAKWERELNIEITTKDWFNVCETQHTTTNSRLWREFGWKNLTQYFITPGIKSKQTGTQQVCWPMCGNREDTSFDNIINCTHFGEMCTLQLRMF